MVCMNVSNAEQSQQVILIHVRYEYLTQLRNSYKNYTTIKPIWYQQIVKCLSGLHRTFIQKLIELDSEIHIQVPNRTMGVQSKKKRRRGYMKKRDQDHDEENPRDSLPELMGAH